VQEEPEKFQKVFGGHLIFMNIILRKEEGSYLPPIFWTMGVRT
jgi:hypothetical protein